MAANVPCNVRRARGVIFTAVVAAVAIGGTFSAQTHQHGVRHVNALAVVLLAVMCAALLLRSYHPSATLLIVTPAVCVYFAAGFPWGPVFLPMTVAIVSAVLAGRRTHAWIACGVMYAFVVWGGYYLSHMGRRPGLTGAVETAAWPLLVLIGAEVLRSGRERAASAARSREELARRRASDERLRIAQELHDVLAHNISLISVQAGVALHLMDDDPDTAADKAKTALTAIKQASKEALGELRSVLGMLRASSGEQAPLSPVPGLEQLNDLTARASAAGLTVRTEVEGDKRPLAPETDLAAYRIVQEALTNVIRHADASSVTVRVRYGSTDLGIEIEDDGRGASRDDGSPAARGGQGFGSGASQPGGRDRDLVTGHGGNGIPGMRERARLLGGRLIAGPQPGSGFLVRATLPRSRRGAAATAATAAGNGGSSGASPAPDAAGGGAPDAAGGVTPTAAASDGTGLAGAEVARRRS